MLTKQLVGTSGEVWAKQASGVITLVGAATHNAKLSYPFSKDIAYTINIENRLIQVISHYKTESEASPNVPIGIELGKVTLENTHGITIEKKLKEKTATSLPPSLGGSYVMREFVYSVGKYE
jgi:predicted ribonuclease toxin of YeeF-YezG toxin-antitoxin module